MEPREHYYQELHVSQVRCLPKPHTNPYTKEKKGAPNTANLRQKFHPAWLEKPMIFYLFAVGG
jgi:hypothetical protein